MSSSSSAKTSTESSNDVKSSDLDGGKSTKMQRSETEASLRRTGVISEDVRLSSEILHDFSVITAFVRVSQRVALISNPFFFLYSGAYENAERFEICKGNGDQGYQ